jgi:hypothetical protein
MSLVSPGVSVTVTDESFYASAGAGTVPLIVIATAQNKTSPDGAGVAPFTTASEAGKLKLITSQRELLQGYGNPIFYQTGGSPRHGYELNEFGLQAAYSFLGIANRAYVLRADVDLGLLEPSATPPGALPADGLYWLNTSILQTRISIKRWNGSAWVLQNYLVPNADQMTGSAPKSSFGLNGNFAVAYVNSAGETLDEIAVWQKNQNTWFLVGGAGWQSAFSADFQYATHTNIPTERSNASALDAGDVFIQTSRPNEGSFFGLRQYVRSNDQFVEQPVALYANSTQAYDAFGLALGDDSVAAIYGPSDARINLVKHNGNPTTVFLGSVFNTVDLSDALANADIVAFNISVDNGPDFGVTFQNFALDNANVDHVVTEINRSIGVARVNAANLADNLVAQVVGGQIRFVEQAGRDVELSNVVPGFLASIGLTAGIYSNWEPLVYEASSARPVGPTQDGTLWYDNTLSLNNIDLLVNTQSGWVTFSNDLQLSPSVPATASGGGALAPGDLWINTADLENYPQINRWSGSNWVRLNNADQETSAGVVFADFRPAAGASLDSDAPNPVLFPNDILGWNKRASGGNVKTWNASTQRWVDASGNASDGVPYMLRKAQRKIIVRRLQEAVVSNTDLRNETNRFNLIAVPGYAELIDEMIQLNVDRKETAFVLADAPMRLPADGISIQRWANNLDNAPENGDRGLISSTPYAAVYYPHGLTTGLDGTNIFVPASHMALRTLAFNDQVSFPWFAPAGFQRGLVTNATSVGFISPVTGEFVAVSLNEGQRDTLYINRINPIGNFPGRGLAVFGQKTLSPTASALDRVNVARLVVYLRERLDDIVRGFLFEPNDEATRANAKSVVERFLGQVLSQRGLFDYVVVCDDTNNTPARIDRNELWIDVAVQPTKAVEFIYIPLRIQSTQGAND